MSITIQTLVGLQATNHAPSSSSVASPAVLNRQVEKLSAPPTAKAPLAAEFQQGTRNARIQVLASGEHSVLCYDAAMDYNELLIRPTAQSAADAAQGWVKRKF